MWLADADIAPTDIGRATEQMNEKDEGLPKDQHGEESLGNESTGQEQESWREHGRTHRTRVLNNPEVEPHEIR